MDKFKEDFYIATYDEALKLEKPTADEMSKLTAHLVALQITDNNLFERLRNHCNYSKPIEQLDKQVGLQDALIKLKLNEQTEVIVIWKFPDDIDKFELSYLLIHWEDVWYPTSDEAVCLFFPLTYQLILITDYGMIYY
jgi:hypothetical protein